MTTTLRRHLMYLVRKHLVYDFAYQSIGATRLHQLQQNPTRDVRHNYTQFLRLPLQTQILLDQCLPLMIRKNPKHHIKINIFGVSQGAEAYSLAAKILEKYPNLDFSIRASDRDLDLIKKARRARYHETEVHGRWLLGEDFFHQLFERQGADFEVKPRIRRYCRFDVCDILSPEFLQQNDQADIVVAQNVLCHLPNDAVPLAFQHVVSTLAPFGIILLDGMPLDLRVQLTREYDLHPQPTKIRQIHQQARSHIPDPWWNYYFGLEPYRFWARHRQRRYATIFLTRSFAHTAYHDQNSRHKAPLRWRYGLKS